MPQTIHVVVGAQYGSEGKGHITAQLVQEALEAGDSQVINVRVAGPNAGHTVVDREGNVFPLRTVPVGAAISDFMLYYIAPGSEIDPEVLFYELDLLRSKDHPVTLLYISGEATILTQEHKEQEATESLTDRIGSTGKGIGAARADRIMRTAKRVKDDPIFRKKMATYGVRMADPEQMYADDAITQKQTIIVEGTQGYGLGLHAGHYPQVTSSDTRAIDFLAMAGISPWRAETTLHVWLAARVYPIRVAGNSGPLKGETTWGELGLPEELTTVTHKVRRVGHWDAELVQKAVQANGGRNSKLAITMTDQLFPELAGTTEVSDFKKVMTPDRYVEFCDWITDIEEETGAFVYMITTSPSTKVTLIDY